MHITGATGFVKMINPTPLLFRWSDDKAEASERALAALEEQALPCWDPSLTAGGPPSPTRIAPNEQILGEGPATIAAIMIESIVGSGGTFVAPEGYMQGVRALCDRHGIVLILDEVRPQSYLLLSAARHAAPKTRLGGRPFCR